MSSPQGRLQPRLKSARIDGLAFPNGYDSPSFAPETGSNTTIAAFVLIKFVEPKVRPCLGNNLAVSAPVSVPVATVDEDHGLVLWKHNVRRAGEIAAIESKAIAQAVECAAYSQLGGCIFGPNPRHVPASLFAGQSISHHTPASVSAR